MAHSGVKTTMLAFLAIALLAFSALFMAVPKAYASYESLSAIYVTDTPGNDPVLVSANTDASGSGWTWDSGDKILTLSGFQGEKIQADGDLAILLDGENHIYLPEEPSDSTVYGIYSDGEISIDALNGPEDSLTVSANPIPRSDSSWTYIYGIRAMGDVIIDGGAVSIAFDEGASDPSLQASVIGICPFNGSLYVNNDAVLGIDIDVPHAGAKGIIRSLYADTTGDITVDINAKSDTSTSAVEWVIASGSGACSFSHPNALAVSGKIIVSDGAGRIDLEGIVSLETANNGYVDDFHLPAGYRFTTPSADVAFLTKDIGRSSLYTVLCNPDGSVVTQAAIESVGASNDPLTFVDSPAFDITGLKLNESYNGGRYGSGAYLNGAVFGGTAPYTWSATGLPAGLRLYSTTTSQSAGFLNYVVGTPTETTPAGTATITVTDANNVSASITISYGEVVSPPKYLSIDGTDVNINEDKTGTGWTYTGSTHTVALNGYDGGPIICDECNLNVVLTGTNIITLPEDSDDTASGTSSGIKVGTGDLVISSSTGSTAGKLLIQGTAAPTSFGYYECLVASQDLIINSGAVSMNFNEATGNTKEMHFVGCRGNNGSAYINGSATLSIEVNAIHAHAKGFDRSLYADTTGDITVDINAKSDTSTSAVEWVIASGSGACSFSHPNALAVSGKIIVSDGAGRIDLEGIVSLETANNGYVDDFHLPAGYRFTTPSADVAFLTKDIGRSSLYTVLCNPDGSVVTQAAIESVGASNDPLTFVDSPAFDITGLKLNESYNGGRYGSGAYLNGAVFGGTAPYTWSATGLPAGLRLYSTTTSQSAGFLNYVVGTPTAESDCGTATITVTDAAGATKSIQISYNAIVDGIPVSGISLDKSELVITSGGTGTLVATVLPDNTKYKSVSWSKSGAAAYLGASTTESGASVTVHGDNPGVSTVSATSFGGFKKTCTVYVREQVPQIKISVTGVDEGILQGFDSSGSYSISAGGSQIATVSDSYSTPITADMRGKTLSIVKLNSESRCDSDPQTLSVPMTIEQTDISTYESVAEFVETSLTYSGSGIAPAVTIPGLVEGTDFQVSYSDNVNAGSGAHATIWGINGYIGSFDKYFTISPKPIYDSTISVAGVASSYTYTGAEILPNFEVRDGSKALVKDVDYTVSVINNKDVGTATINIKGTGNYSSVKNVTFAIRPANISGATITVPAQTYTGSAIKPAVKVVKGGNELVLGTDYTIVGYENNVGLGTATVTIQGEGSFTGTDSVSFTIEAQPLNASRVTLSAASYTYDGNAKKPSVTVKNAAGTALTEGADYTIVGYENNTNVGTAVVKVKGKGCYTGTAEKTFTINKAVCDMSGVKFDGKSFTYDGKAHSLAVSGTLPEGVSVSYSGSKTAVGSATVTATFAGDANHEAPEPMTAKVTIKPLNIASSAAAAKMTLSTTAYQYNGKAKKPAVTVTATVGGTSKTLMSKKTASGTAITLAYTSGRTKVGTYKVTATGTGNYTGTITKTFKVNPAKAYMKSVATYGKGTLKWTATSKPTTKGGSYYQVQYRKQGTSTYKYSTSSKTYYGKVGGGKLTKGKRYYVRVRAVYKTSSGSTYYGAWSTAKLSPAVK